MDWCHRSHPNDPSRAVPINLKSRVRTGHFLVKLTETVVNLTKFSPMRTAGKVTKLSSIDHRLLVLPSHHGYRAFRVMEELHCQFYFACNSRVESCCEVKLTNWSREFGRRSKCCDLCIISCALCIVYTCALYTHVHVQYITSLYSTMYTATRCTGLRIVYISSVQL